MRAPTVSLERTEAATIIRLNRPARHNALVPELLRDLLDALNDERGVTSSTIILAAEGRSFSTGGDLLAFWQHREHIADYALELVGLLNEVILALYTCPVPVVCAVQGQVTGGSLGLLLPADRVIMHPDASVTPWYSEVGFSPDGGWTALLPRVIGRQQATDWLSSNASLSANKCHELGIVQELAPDDVLGAALAWSSRVASSNAASIRKIRSLLSQDAETVATLLELERRAFVEQIQTPEATAGIARFLGKEIS